MELAKYIISVLKTNLGVVLSWGFNSPVAIENGLRFAVNGFKFQGWVSIQYNDCTDLFDITLKNAKHFEAIEGIYVDSLVEVLDIHIETGNDSPEQYKNNVSNWLNNPHNHV